MDMTEQTAESLCAPEKLGPWMDRHVPEAGSGPVQATLRKGGATNIVMRIDRGGIPVVLRRPPAVHRPDSAQVLGREARVLAALTGSDVPAPQLYACCNDAAVIGERQRDV